MDTIFDASTSAPGPRADVVERAVKIRPLLCANAEQADKDRLLPPATVDALLENELINLMVPRRFGGLQCNVRTYVDTVIEMARGDSSAGWYGFILNCAGWATGMYPEAAQKEVWGRTRRPSFPASWPRRRRVSRSREACGSPVNGPLPPVAGMRIGRRSPTRFWR
jgi:alkylation response protein AidB-like acyl-CoA dehydrogenase